jgi:hypothetical protein
MSGNQLTNWQRRVIDYVKSFAGSGPFHRRRLSNIDIRISVSGVRGKSTAVRWLQDLFYARGYDTYAKVTGVVPTSIYNGKEHVIDRPRRVRLYENERELRKFGDVDVAVFENQGIRPYTTRLVNQQFVNPDVVFLTNVREDHLDSLGKSRHQIARSLARSIPPGTHVVSGEQDTTLREYLEREITRRKGVVTHVDVPLENRTIPGSELVYGLNEILDIVDEPVLGTDRIEAYLDRLEVTWTCLPNGRVYNAASANDPQSTELIRRRLVGDNNRVVQPLLYLRSDRRGRTASFLRYCEKLFEDGYIEQVRVAGEDTQLFARRASFPVVRHDSETESPSAVLDGALEDGWPVLLMANTVADFMYELDEIIETRDVENDRRHTLFV